MNTHIERLANGKPRFTVRDHAPRSPKNGCMTHDVFDRARGVVVYGPTTISWEAAAECGRFSVGADIALPAAVADASQLRLEV